MNAKDALRVAEEEVRRLAIAAGDRFEPLPEKTREVKDGWIFFYNTTEYIRSGNPSPALAGNGPIFVSRNGRVALLSSAIPLREALKQLEGQ